MAILDGEPVAADAPTDGSRRTLDGTQNRSQRRQRRRFAASPCGVQGLSTDGPRTHPHCMRHAAATLDGTTLDSTQIQSHDLEMRYKTRRRNPKSSRDARLIDAIDMAIGAIARARVAADDDDVVNFLRAWADIAGNASSAADALVFPEWARGLRELQQHVENLRDTSSDHAKDWMLNARNLSSHPRFGRHAADIRKMWSGEVNMASLNMSEAYNSAITGLSPNIVGELIYLALASMSRAAANLATITGEQRMAQLHSPRMSTSKRVVPAKHRPDTSKFSMRWTSRYTNST